MPITEERAQQVRSMFSLLGVSASGDFKSDTNSAIKSFVSLYNRGRKDDQPELSYSGTYTKEFGQKFIAAAAHLQSRFQKGLDDLKCDTVSKYFRGYHILVVADQFSDRLDKTHH